MEFTIMNETERAITEVEAAERLGLSIKTLRAWRCRGRGPRFVRFGRSVRYFPSDIEEFIRLNRVETSMSDVLFSGV
jgi:predicted DNA-binding transcriptional regulator AlpA